MLCNGHEAWFLTDGQGNREMIDRPGRLRANHGEALVDWALAGFGIAFASDFDVAHALEDGALERVLPGWTGPAMPVIALYPSGDYLPLKVRVALDTLASRAIALLARMTRTLHGDPGTAMPHEDRHGAAADRGAPPGR